ncbi:unnamed protein product [Paramecium primaurelia]|uniref:G domain-containing protein n=1 Tax=Paramecium primaurelia TaxID=5886 RepID=A0A8S1PA99_PARPR|nr:unnamed protein product [Paramecium primaurelia]
MKKAVLLTGQIGTGRTTLFNKITNSQFKTWLGGSIATRDTYVKNSQYGEGFTLIDTLGFGDSNNIDTISGHLKIFENIEISRIMIVARYDSNYYRVYSCTTGIIEMFQRYKDKITIVITFFDECDEKYEPNFKNDIAKYFEKFQIKSFIITSKQDTGETLCKLFDSEIKYSQASKIKLTETEIISLLNCNDDDEFQWDYQECLSQVSIFIHKAKKQLQHLNGVDFKENYKKQINCVLQYSFTILNDFLNHNQDEKQENIIFIDFYKFLRGQLNYFLEIVHQKMGKTQQCEQHNIELKNLFEDQIRPYSQKILQNINENVKNQKINYL